MSRMKRDIVVVACAVSVLLVCSCSTRHPDGLAIVPPPEIDTIQSLSVSLSSYWGLNLEADGSGHIGHYRTRWGAGAEFPPGTLSIHTVLASLKPHFIAMAFTNALFLDPYGPRPDIVSLNSEIPGELPAVYFWRLDTNHVQAVRPLFDTAVGAVNTNQTRLLKFYFEKEPPWAHNN
jgi:hypothetical protein